MMRPITDFVKEFVQYDCGLTKVRMGNEHDGGYVVLKQLIERSQRLYTYGVGDDVGFELDFIKANPEARVFLFDPTIEGLPINPPQFNFKKVGLPQAYHHPGFIDKRERNVLKVDVEWCEWDFLEQIKEEELLGFEQILIELHAFHVPAPRNGFSPYFQGVIGDFYDRTNMNIFSRYVEVLRKLNKHFYMYHIHANNSLPKCPIHFYSIPPLLEVSFVRKDLVSFATPYVGTLPISGLDAPNKTDRPDITNVYPLGRKD